MRLTASTQLEQLTARRDSLRLDLEDAERYIRQLRTEIAQADAAIARERDRTWTEAESRAQALDLPSPAGYADLMAGRGTAPTYSDLDG